jgi:DNA helicase II / ATP-dependent DNA helicase PcrA
MALDLKKLNKEQKNAVTHKQGPLLIVAGAGTGKTTVITQRVFYLINEKLANPEEILALTFTEKAAEEMEERVDNLLPYGYVDLWVSTFHSFCERILRDHALDIGLPAGFKILDSVPSWLLIRQNFDKFNLNYYKPIGNPTKFIQALVSHFSHCKDQEIYPEDYLKYAEELKIRDDMPDSQETERIKEVANSFHTYQQLLLENNYLDFGDLINYCLRLFKKRPLILEKYRKKFKYILVDEFQDTNWSQYALIKLLAAPKNNLTVCADDDQSVYRWRGASFSNIIQFKKDFPEAKQISLLINYRSGQEILDLAYKFIKANDPDRLEYVNKINKKLIANNKNKSLIEHIKAKNADQEIKKTIEKILEILKKDKAVNYNDIAILVRANNTANSFVKAVQRTGLPYQFLASKGLYSKSIILDIISYFKLLDNCYESSAVYRILNLPFLKIAYEDIVKLTQYSHKKAKSLYESMEQVLLIAGLSVKSQEKINLILSLIRKHISFTRAIANRGEEEGSPSSLAREKTVSEILIAFLKDSGYLKYLTDKDDKEEFKMLNQFYKRVKNFEESSFEPNLKNFMEEINFEIESGENGKIEFDPEQGPDMIKIMTIHGAKGLEFKYVFLVNMVDKRFPTIERKDLIELPEALIKDIRPIGDVHLQEERRICYVAMTRAKKGLYFTSAEDYGLARKKKLSRFLIEMGYKNRKEAKKQKKENNLIDLPSNSKISKKKNSKQEKHIPNHFSFSQLAAFEKCPLQYKFNFILKIPIKGKAVFSFGKTMHNTFYQFLKMAGEEDKSSSLPIELLQSKSEGKEESEALFAFAVARANKNNEGSQKELFNFQKQEKPKINNIIEFSDLLSIYKKNWIEDWYESKKQKQEYYELGKKIIKNFYKEFQENPPKIAKINNSLALEIPFNLKIAENKLYGIIDRIDEEEQGVSIIDYKTGKFKEKLTLEDKKQLLIYQIATEEIFKLKPKKLIYEYLNDGKKVSFLGSEKEKQALKEKIKIQIAEIKKSEFKATPGWQCNFCDFKDICDFAQK